VISHVERHEDALADMVRVLRPGGRLGVTVWGSLDDDRDDDRDQSELTRIWQSVSWRYASLDAIEERVGGACRHEGWFTDPAHLRAALMGSRLRGVELHGRAYRQDVTLDDALTGYETSFWGRFLRDALGEPEWARFRREVGAEAAAALPDPISLVDHVLIAVGTKPFDARP
jgi:SAM-dependent methyltransferase